MYVREIERPLIIKSTHETLEDYGAQFAAPHQGVPASRLRLFQASRRLLEEAGLGAAEGCACLMGLDSHLSSGFDTFQIACELYSGYS